MQAIELLNHFANPLSINDTGEHVIEAMQDEFLRHLPVVEEGVLLGVIGEEDILDYDLSLPIKSFAHIMKQVYVKTNDHIFDVMQIIAKSKLTIIPVVGNDLQYVGLITQDDLLKNLALHYSFGDPGSVVVIQTKKNDFSIAQISRIIEAENGQILSCFVSHFDNENVHITIKINLMESYYIKATFERYGLDVINVFTEQEYLDGLRERYDSLIHYLSI